MKLTQLQYFSCVSEYGSFTKAAEHLHITQPSLSKSIAELEAEAGSTLLLRTKSGVLLTEDGQAVLEQVRNILHETDVLESMFERMGRTSHTLKIGIPPTMGYCFIPGITERVSAFKKPVPIEWKESGTNQLEQLLRSGKLDAAIVPRDFVNMDNLEWRRFRDVEEILFVARNHRLANKRIITADMITDERFVLFSEEYNQNVPFEKLFNNGGFYPQRVTYTSQLSTALNLVEKNMAVSVMIRDIWEQSHRKSNFRAISLDPPYHLELVLVWKKQTHLSWEMRVFIHAIEETQESQPSSSSGSAPNGVASDIAKRNR